MSILANKAMWMAVLGVGVAVGLVLGFTTKDADAGKRQPPPPNYNFVLCSAGQNPCSGTSGADLMVGAAGNETLQGFGGRDIYMSSAGDFDVYFDDSTSSDLYGGFVNTQFGSEFIFDKGGLDRVDLSTNVSAYASTDFVFTRYALSSDEVENDLRIEEKNLEGLDGDDKISVADHFGIGRIESIKFTDKTLTAADIARLAT